ncbi:hypothetical protein B0H14DRAFT_2562982 [Mycena olivaceomarginata]|nr:hypothetical protein B0H14DRAFT_2562982 [Mycena olivaceomarginata]
MQVLQYIVISQALQKNGTSKEEHNARRRENTTHANERANHEEFVASRILDEFLAVSDERVLAASRAGIPDAEGKAPGVCGAVVPVPESSVGAELDFLACESWDSGDRCGGDSGHPNGGNGSKGGNNRISDDFGYSGNRKHGRSSTTNGKTLGGNLGTMTPDLGGTGRVLVRVAQLGETLIASVEPLKVTWAGSGSSIPGREERRRDETDSNEGYVDRRALGLELRSRGTRGRGKADAFDSSGADVGRLFGSSTHHFGTRRHRRHDQEGESREEEFREVHRSLSTFRSGFMDTLDTTSERMAAWLGPVRAISLYSNLPRPYMGINLYSHVFFNFKARSDYEICGTKRTAVSSEWAGDGFMLVYLTMPTSDDLATSVPAISAGAAEATARETREMKEEWATYRMRSTYLLAHNRGNESEAQRQRFLGTVVRTPIPAMLKLTIWLGSASSTMKEERGMLHRPTDKNYGPSPRNGRRLLPKLSVEKKAAVRSAMQRRMSPHRPLCIPHKRAGGAWL